MDKKVFIIDGVRTPFVRSQKAFSDLKAHDLSKCVVNGLVFKSKIDPLLVEYVSIGSVLINPDISNIARETVLLTQLSKNTPAHSVSMACISSNAACTSVARMISMGSISCGIAGGAETFSDLPIRFSEPLRKLMLKARKAKGIRDYLNIMKDFRFKFLKPDIPSAKEYSTGFSMGQAGDQLAAKFGITREQADEFAHMSHQRAITAWRAGYYEQNVMSVNTGKKSGAIQKDDGPREDSDLKKMAKLKPSFNKYGINTAANSSFFSDGASAVILGNYDFARTHGLKPLALIKDFIFQAGDPYDELLLGPALTTPLLLHKNNLSLKDIDVWEIHEAFAGQVLANLRAMKSPQFLKSRLSLESGAGEIDMNKVNLWGGSLSLGHPFGATGTRLIHTAALRLIHEEKRLALITACAAGGLGFAMLLERA